MHNHKVLIFPYLRYFTTLAIKTSLNALVKGMCFCFYLCLSLYCKICLSVRKGFHDIKIDIFSQFIVTGDGFSGLFGALKNAKSIKRENKRIIFDIYSVEKVIRKI